MEVAHRQQLGLARSQPIASRRSLALRAMPIATAVVANNGVTAFVVLALRDVAAERRSPAALDRRHHLQLVEAHMSCVDQAPSGTVVAEDVRNLQSWTGHETGVTSPAAPRALPARELQIVKRAVDGGDQTGGYACVACRRLQLVVSQKRLNRPD